MAKLPEVAQAISAPLAKTERIIITSDEQGAGAARVTSDVAQIISQLSPMIKSLIGVDLAELISQIPELGAPQQAEMRPKRGPDAA